MARSLLYYQQPGDDEDALMRLLDDNSQPPSVQAAPPPTAAPDPGGDQLPDIPAAPASRGFSLRDNDQLTATMLNDGPPRFSPPSQPAGDPELEQARRQAELGALHNANFDRGGYGFGEFARDNGAALLASILDIGFNKGRGLGGIVGATANEVGKQEAARLQRAKDAGEFATRLRGGRGGLSPEEIALRERQLAVNEGNLGLRGTQIGNTQNRFDVNRSDKIDPNSQANQTKRTMAYDTSAQRTRGSLDTQNELIDRTADNKAQISGAETAARINTELDLGAQTREASALKAAGDAEARLPAEQTLKRTPSPTEERARADEDLTQSEMPGVTVEDSRAWRAAAMKNRKGLGDYVSGTQTAISALDKAIELRQRLGPAWNNLTDQERAVAQQQLSDLQKQIIGGATVVGNSGVLNGTEFPRYAADIPSGGLALSDFSDQAVSAFTGQQRDTQLEKLMAARQAFQGAADAGLKYAGARFGSSPQPFVPMPPPQRPGLNPVAPAQPGQLGAPVTPASDDFMQRYEQYKRQRGAQP